MLDVRFSLVFERCSNCIPLKSKNTNSLIKVRERPIASHRG
ncbi:Hypothetical protein AJF4211_000520 [Avibacterium paragallinarum JF4211]|nr:Hypothetical protein AJF4211_000520 [Avibacterium paragallinarum JF4211]